MTETPKVTQEFLDSSQYEESSILQYESIYGADFVSPGGRELALEMIATMDLAPASRVLDVGCGLGGSAFVMASEFSLQVDGIDLSRNMLALAEQKLATNGLSDLVRLRWGDCLELDAREQYDAIYSRDVFLHIADKVRLFERLHTALQPGGKLLFTDYCCGAKPWSDVFDDYVQDRGYSLHTVGEYADLISAAGFEQVSTNDETARFIEILQAEQERIGDLSMPAAERDYLKQSWQGKLQRAGEGDQRWGLFSAVKAG
jgi:phosphoethanolamine N-methyltransferase